MGINDAHYYVMGHYTSEDQGWEDIKEIYLDNDYTIEELMYYMDVDKEEYEERYSGNIDQFKSEYIDQFLEYQVEWSILELKVPLTQEQLDKTLDIYWDITDADIEKYFK